MGLHHWQASHPGSSMAQNLMSVAGSLAGSADTAAAATGAFGVTETALSWPVRPVDFSICVAEVVRR